MCYLKYKILCQLRIKKKGINEAVHSTGEVGVMCDPGACFLTHKKGIYQVQKSEYKCRYFHGDKDNAHRKSRKYKDKAENQSRYSSGSPCGIIAGIVFALKECG